MVHVRPRPAPQAPRALRQRPGRRPDPRRVFVRPLPPTLLFVRPLSPTLLLHPQHTKALASVRRPRSSLALRSLHRALRRRAPRPLRNTKPTSTRGCWRRSGASSACARARAPSRPRGAAIYLIRVGFRLVGAYPCWISVGVRRAAAAPWAVSRPRADAVRAGSDAGSEAGSAAGGARVQAAWEHAASRIMKRLWKHKFSWPFCGPVDPVVPPAPPPPTVAPTRRPTVLCVLPSPPTYCCPYTLNPDHPSSRIFPSPPSRMVPMCDVHLPCPRPCAPPSPCPHRWPQRRAACVPRVSD